MGLNIGVWVTHQLEGYMSHGSNPKGELAEVEDRFFAFLFDRFPDGGFGRGGVTLRDKRDGVKVWDFDVRMGHYGAEFGGDLNPMYLAIYEFVLREFSVVEGIKSEAYWSG